MADNLFSVLGITPSFALAEADLERAYIEAQQKFHPDRHIGKSPAEKNKALLQSMQVNEAYETLKKPLTRARHILALQGITVGSEQDSVKPAHELLMEVMESREQAEEVTSPDELTKIQQETEKNLAETIKRLSIAFQKNALPEAAQLTIRLGYLEKLNEDIRVRKQKFVKP